MTAARRFGLSLATYRSTLGMAGFRRLWLATVASRAGDVVNFVALPLLAFATTRSASAVAALVVAEGLALLVGASAAQLVVDRVEPRRLLIAVDCLRALAAAMLVLIPTFAAALAVAATLAVGTSLFSPTVQALLPRLVAATSLSAANGLQWTAGVALQIVAAPLTGLLFTLSPRIAFGVNAVSFAASATLLAGLPRYPALAVASTGWRQLPEDWRALRAIPVVAPLMAMQGLAALAVGATSALLVVLAQGAYGLSGGGFGMWLAAVGAGALLGPLMVPAVSRLPSALTVPTAYIARGAGDIGLGVLSVGAAGGALLFAYGLNTSSGSVAFQLLVQEAVPPQLRGRAFALLDATWQGARLVSIGIGGVVAAILGIRAVFIGGGALLLLAGVVGWMALYPDGSRAAPGEALRPESSGMRDAPRDR